MPLTASDVANKQFTTVKLREGYNMEEVDGFLDEVEAELGRLHREIDDLTAKAAARPGRCPPHRRPAARSRRPSPRRPSRVGRAPAAAPTDAAVRMLELAAEDRRRARQRGQGRGRQDPRRRAGDAPAHDGRPRVRARQHAGQGRRAQALREGVPHPAAVLPRGSAARPRRQGGVPGRPAARPRPRRRRLPRRPQRAAAPGAPAAPPVSARPGRRRRVGSGRSRSAAAATVQPGAGPGSDAPSGPPVQAD